MTQSCDHRCLTKLLKAQRHKSNIVLRLLNSSPNSLAHGPNICSEGCIPESCDSGWLSSLKSSCLWEERGVCGAPTLSSPHPAAGWRNIASGAPRRAARGLRHSSSVSLRQPAAPAFTAHNSHFILSWHQKCSPGADRRHRDFAGLIEKSTWIWWNGERGLCFYLIQSNPFFSSQLAATRLHQASRCTNWSTMACQT